MLISPAHINPYTFKSWWQPFHPIPNIFLTSSIFLSQFLSALGEPPAQGFKVFIWSNEKHTTSSNSNSSFQSLCSSPRPPTCLFSSLHKNGVMILNLSLGIWFLVFLGTYIRAFLTTHRIHSLPLSYYLAQDCSQLPVNTEKGQVLSCRRRHSYIPMCIN